MVVRFRGKAMAKTTSSSFSITVNQQAAPRAFPGAEGLAALTRGAVGYAGNKSVAIVSNLNNSGAGSLREAVGGSGKEGTFVVFTVSGVINLTSRLDIESSYITIAGQTSPGGVCLAGYGMFVGNSSNSVHDIIIRHMRMRVGSHEAGGTSDNDAFRVKQSQDVYIDHCSFSWGGDEILDCPDGTNPLQRVTFNKCIMTQGLEDPAPEADHNYGWLLPWNNRTDNSINIHQCMISDCRRRFPTMQGNGFVHMSNCVTYNWDRFYNTVIQYIGSDVQWNHIGNYAKGGPNGTSNAGEINGHSSLGTPYKMLYMENNFGEKRAIASDGEWCITDYSTGNLLGTGWQSSTKFAFPAGIEPTVTTLNTNESTAETQMLALMADWGATKPSRDSVDTAAINRFQNNIDGWIANRSYPGDWPSYSGSAPVDSDADGIPDSYEQSKGFTATSMDPLALAPTGYYWIEEYVNSMA